MAAAKLVNEVTEPTEFEVLAYVDAVDAFNDWAGFEHKFPYEGALLDQPHLWKLAIDCITGAQREAHARASWDAKPEDPEE